MVAGDEGHADPAVCLRPIVQGGGENLRVPSPLLVGGRFPDPRKRQGSGLKGRNDIFPRLLDDEHLPFRQSEVITGKPIHLVQHPVQQVRRLHGAIQLPGCTVDQSNQPLGGVVRPLRFGRFFRCGERQVEQLILMNFRTFTADGRRAVKCVPEQQFAVQEGSEELGALPVGIGDGDCLDGVLKREGRLRVGSLQPSVSDSLGNQYPRPVKPPFETASMDRLITARNECRRIGSEDAERCRRQKRHRRHRFASGPSVARILQAAFQHGLEPLTDHPH